MKRRFLRILMTVVSIGLFAFLHEYAVIPLSVANVRISYAYPYRDFISVVMGPVAGGLVGAVGTLVTAEDFSLSSILMIVINGLDAVILGILCRKIDVKSGFFGKNELLTFLKSSVLGHFICYIVVRTVVLCFFNDAPNLGEDVLPRTLSTGMWMLLIDSILSLDVTTLLLVVYAKTRVSEANFYRN